MALKSSHFTQPCTKAGTAPGGSTTGSDGTTGTNGTEGTNGTTGLDDTTQFKVKAEDDAKVQYPNDCSLGCLACTDIFNCIECGHGTVLSAGICEC